MSEIPAQAREAALKAVHEKIRTDEPMDTPIYEADLIDEALAAAAPLIVADRDAYRDHADDLHERIVDALAIVDGYPGQTERKAMPWMNVCALRAALAGGKDKGETGDG
jgi:hypothetical protein